MIVVGVNAVVWMVSSWKSYKNVYDSCWIFFSWKI